MTRAPTSAKLAACLLVASLASVTCTKSGPKRELLPRAECPTDGLLNGHVPLYPGTKLVPGGATTRGHMDHSGYTAEIAAPYPQVLEFYTRCLGTRPALVGAEAWFARPVVGDAWVPGDQVPRLLAEPRDMSDQLRLMPRDDGDASMRISLAETYGREKLPPARP